MQDERGARGATCVCRLPGRCTTRITRRPRFCVNGHSRSPYGKPVCVLPLRGEPACNRPTERNSPLYLLPCTGRQLSGWAGVTYFRASRFGL